MENKFVFINNRQNFLISKVPTIHPSSIRYIEYWKRHKKRCIEGFWCIDDADTIINADEDIPKKDLSKKGKWRYMPSNLYFYVNFGTILHNDPDGPKSAPKKRRRPDLRDIEWELFYNWIEARGFSGFKDDDLVSCDRAILEVGKGIITKEELSKECFNSKGEIKEYVDANSYLRKLHDTPLNYALYNNSAKNLMMLGSRGFGKSYSVGVGIILHELLFDGAKVYSKQSITDPYQVEIFVGAALSSKSADILSKTKAALEHLKGDWGGDTRSYTPAPFSKKMAGSLEPNNMKNPWRHEYDKKIGGLWKKFGTGSNIKHGLFTTENPEAAAGTRPGIIAVEEVGLLPNVLTVHGSNAACQMEGNWKFGSTIYLGTGGNVDKIQEAEIIFRDPEGFDFLAFNDHWEGSGKIGWFVPAIYAMSQFKDSNGNTNVEKALQQKELDREKKRKSRDASALALEMMNYPLIPSEMFLNAKGSMFPQAELKSHLAEVTSKPHEYENANYHGELVWTTDGSLKWESTNANKLEKKHPISDNKNRPGVIEVYEMPKRNSSKEVITNRYLQGTDTYDDDESNTSSLGSTLILDSWTDRIVAEYTGRRGTKDFYEITRKLSIFYKTTHNYEQNKKGLYSYYDGRHCTHLLCDTPQSLKDVADITISKVGNKRKGTHASGPINAHGLRLILDWLLESAYGEDPDSGVLVLHKLRGEGLIRELMGYKSVGNFDRVSALIMLMIIREDRKKYIENKQKEKVKTLLDDDFFSRNYKPHKQRGKISRESPFASLD